MLSMGGFVLGPYDYTLTCVVKSKEDLKRVYRNMFCKTDIDEWVKTLQPEDYLSIGDPNTCFSTKQLSIRGPWLCLRYSFEPLQQGI